MPEEKRIVIEIVSTDGNGGENGLSSRVSTSSTESTDENMTYQMAGGANDNGLANAMPKIASVAALVGLVVNSVGGQALHQMNMYFNLTEDYKSQQAIANIKSVGNKIGGIVGKIGAGALAGSAFGPVGAAVGAGIGAGVAAFDVIMGGKNVQFEQNLDISIKGYSVQYNRNLAGLLVGDSRNTEN